MHLQLFAEADEHDAHRLLRCLERLTHHPHPQPFRFRQVTVDLRGGYKVTGDISMFTLHDDKGADVSFGAPGPDADGNVGTPPANLQVSVVETPPAVAVAMLPDNSGFSVDAIPGMPLSVATVRLTGDSNFTQDFGVTLIGEGATMFPNATIGAERPTTATAAAGSQGAQGVQGPAS